MKHRLHIVVCGAVILAVLWQAPLTPFVRYNFENAFTWATAAVLAFYIATRINVWIGLFLLLASYSAYYPINTDYSETTYQFIFYGVIWYTVCAKAFQDSKSINLWNNKI